MDLDLESCWHIEIDQNVAPRVKDALVGEQMAVVWKRLYVTLDASGCCQEEKQKSSRNGGNNHFNEFFLEKEGAVPSILEEYFSGSVLGN
jgi:hypothetical protein